MLVFTRRHGQTVTASRGHTCIEITCDLDSKLLYVYTYGKSERSFPLKARHYKIASGLDLIVQRVGNKNCSLAFAAPGWEICREEAVIKQ